MPRKNGINSSSLETTWLEAPHPPSIPQPHHLTARHSLGATTSTNDPRHMPRHSTFDHRPIHSPSEQMSNIDPLPCYQQATFATYVTARDIGMLAPPPADPERHARAAPLVRSRGPSGLQLRPQADSPTRAVRRPQPRTRAPDARPSSWPRWANRTAPCAYPPSSPASPSPKRPSPHCIPSKSVHRTAARPCSYRPRRSARRAPPAPSP
jgi:hypothetical protein